MSEAWKQWEGRIVDGKFPLRQFLGGSEHSAVFLSERGDPAQRVAIKFIQVEPSAAELQLSRWQRTAKFAHPHLLRLYESGRCRIGDFNLLYLVMEYANENLAEFLPQRPLTPAETRDVLAPALEALGFLHHEGLVHGHIQPSNILAIDDQLKLSSDTISPATLPKLDDAKVTQQHPPASEGEFREITRAGESAMLRRPSPYCAPEALKGATSREADIWSLGMTLAEMLTQRAPAFDYTSRQDPVLPETLPALYLDIARHCLKRDPKQRWTVAQVAERLNPGAPAAIRTVEMVQAAPPAEAPAPSVALANATSPAVAAVGLSAGAVPPGAPAIAGVGPISSVAPVAMASPATGPSVSSASSVSPAAPSSSAAGTAPAIAKPAPPQPQTVVTATSRVPAPVPSKSEPYHIPAARPPLQSHTVARGDARHHDTGLPGLPKLKRPPLMPMPKGNFFVLGFGIGVVIVTIFALRLFSHHAPVKQQTVASAAAEPAAPVQKTAQPPVRGKAQPKNAQKPAATSSTQAAAKTPAPSVAPNAVKSASEKQPISAPPANAKAPAPSSSTDSTSAATVPPSVAAEAAGGHVVHGEVLNQVLPDVSDKARSTIWGTVRVAVKVHVDPVGNVAGAELDSPGPSRFFADKALQAAKNWDFAPAKLDGHNVASDWLIKFHFTPSTIKVYPTEERP